MANDLGLSGERAADAAAEPTGRSARRVTELIDRDGPACAWCGRDPWPGTATIDHVCPRSRGGTAELENLLLACRKCNKARRSAYLRERREGGAEVRVEVVRAALDRLAASPRRGHREYAEQQLRHWDSAAGAGVEAPADPS